MPLRRTAMLATLVMLYARASNRVRAIIVAGSVLSLLGKLLPVLVALRIASDDVHGAAVIGVTSFVVMGASRVVSSGVRVNAECDLHRAIARSLLESDVLSTPTRQPFRALFEPLFHARTLITETVPELVASALAAIVVLPVLVATLPSRALIVSGIAIVVVLGVLVALSRVSTSIQRRVWIEQDNVHERVGHALDGRLELVARGAEDAALHSLDRAIDRFRMVARRGAWGSALLGRAPVAAGIAAVVLILVLDTSYREAVTSAVLARALVLAACLPIGLGVVLRVSELQRLSVMVDPVLDVLSAPRRAELLRTGEEPPRLPATIAARDLTFSYAPGAAPTLRAVSFEWRPGTTLLVEGPNGSGKSTLLRLLLGLREAQSGSLTVGGVEISSLDLRAFRRGIAYLPQRPYLGEGHATVRSALRIVDDAVSDGALTQALARVGLTEALARNQVDALDVPVGELSAGQRQRVALARLLLQDASIYLLDEPDANVDRAGIALLSEIVSELVAAGRMVAIAAHTGRLSEIASHRLDLEGEAGAAQLMRSVDEPRSYE